MSSEMSRMSEGDGRGPLGKAIRRRWRDLKDGTGLAEATWHALRDVLLPTLLDISDELDALREERGKPKKRTR